MILRKRGAMARTEAEERQVLRVKRKRIRLSEETQGLEDCGHASRGRYTSGCRCEACRKAAREYERQRVRRKAYGKPSNLVDAEPVRQRVRKLQQAGYSMAEICRVSGVAKSTLDGIMRRHWRTGKPCARCQRHVKDAIFGIKGKRRLKGTQLVDAAEIRRDIDRWTDAGITVARIADVTGTPRNTLDSVRHGRRDKVRATTLYRHRMAKDALDREAGSRMLDAMDIIGL